MFTWRPTTEKASVLCKHFVSIPDKFVNLLEKTASLAFNGPSTSVFAVPSKKRLEGGRTNADGRIEYNNAGTWYSYCDSGWNKSDAEVICRELGFW